MGILQVKPARITDDYTHSHAGKGVEYQARFTDRPPRALMWQLERELVGNWLNRLQPRRLLDFACGTGRIAGLAAELTGAEVHGVDVTESMLAVARQEHPAVTYHLADGRDAPRLLGERRFDVATAFRFFANAEPELRASAAAALASLISHGGHLIVNNHRSFWSIPYVGQRLVRRGAQSGATNREVRDILVGHGFEVVERRSLGVWPQTEQRFLGRPGMVERVERWNLRQSSGWHVAGYNTVWLLRREG